MIRLIQRFLLVQLLPLLSPRTYIEHDSRNEKIQNRKIRRRRIVGREEKVFSIEFEEQTPLLQHEASVAAHCSADRSVQRQAKKASQAYLVSTKSG
jgi:hypothetical protein